MDQVYAPGCALMLYKPHLAERILAFLNEDAAAAGGAPVAEHLTCCRHEPGLAPGTRVVNTCAGCDRRYRELYEGVTTVSLWEVLADSETFPFPDHAGAEMAIHDACPTRTETRVHDAVRRLLERMNVTVVEPSATRTRAVCCGDSFFGQLPDEQVKAQMRKRADAMPASDVVVYCVSCVKAMHIGGKRPRYLVDLLFAEETSPATFEPAPWHAELEAFIEAH
jgi:Fe-S oxidoreductase